MEPFDIFSKRQKRIRGEFTDVYTYDRLPHALRIQIIYIINDAVPYQYFDNDILDKIFASADSILRREYGVQELDSDIYPAQEYPVLGFFLKTSEVEKALDVVELVFQGIDLFAREYYEQCYSDSDEIISPDDAVTHLNTRFKEHAVGYSFEGGEIIRVDSTYIHAEITKPTISLLSTEMFAGPNEEYLKAHEHYRHGRNKECLTECLKAFESTMKVICTEKGWTFDPAKDTASALVKICWDKGLVPSYMQNHISALKNLLTDNGIATLRNKTSGHGQGQVPTTVDDQVARYGLNLTGSNIIFLIEQSGL